MVIKELNNAKKHIRKKTLKQLMKFTLKSMTIIRKISADGIKNFMH